MLNTPSGPCLNIVISFLPLVFGMAIPCATLHANELHHNQDTIDPHIYVYTSEFAKKFGMPTAWISDELEGVDAVAYRVAPTYMSCGWAGNLDTCFKHQTHCSLDLYFDKRRNSLQWDERHPRYRYSLERYSTHFISTTLRHQIPVRMGEDFFVKRSPLVSSANGKGVTWRYRFDTKSGRGSGFALISGYERNVFDGVDRITLNFGCFRELNHLDLITGEFIRSHVKTSEGVVKTISFPESWSVRKARKDEKYKSRLYIFLEEEGRKVMKKLREDPVQSTTILPIPK